MDALRGGFGTIGSIIRARSMRKSMMSGTGTASPAVEQWRQRHPYAGDQNESGGNIFMPDMQRHQLWDAPVPRDSVLSAGTGDPDNISLRSGGGGIRPGHKSIKFNTEDTRHFYPTPGTPGQARHESVKTGGSDIYTPGAPTTGTGSTSGFIIPPIGPPASSRPLPKPIDPFADTRFRSDTVGSGSDEDLGRAAEEVPLTASLNKTYPHSGDREADRDESYGLVSSPIDSVKLVNPRRK